MCRGGGICTIYIRSDSTLRGWGPGRVVVLNGSRTNVQNSGIRREIHRRVGRRERKEACTRLPRRKERREADEEGLCQTDRVLDAASLPRMSAVLIWEALRSRVRS